MGTSLEFAWQAGSKGIKTHSTPVTASANVILLSVFVLPYIARLRPPYRLVFSTERRLKGRFYKRSFGQGTIIDAMDLGCASGTAHH